MKTLARSGIALGAVLVFMVTAALSCTPPTGEGTPNGPAPSWGMVHEDNFDGSTLDTSKWTTGWVGNGGITPPVQEQETACYHPDNVDVAYGALILTATDPPGTTSCGGESRPYLSGAIDSHGKYDIGPSATRDVLVEARIEVDQQAGVIANWPAWWLDGNGNWPSTGELDVMEGLSGTAKANWHGPCGSPAGQGFNYGNYGNTSGSGFHTYAAEWRDDRVISYLDGVKVGEYVSASCITEFEQFLIFGLQLSPQGQYGGPVKVPSWMFVDYVRVYTRG